jgi:hypothetical protein
MSALHPKRTLGLVASPSAEVEMDGPKGLPEGLAQRRAVASDEMGGMRPGPDYLDFANPHDERRFFRAHIVSTRWFVLSADD